MKNINITNIVDPTSLQPFTGNSLKFLQDASSEARAGMIKAFITQNLGSYSLTVPYVISGCVVSDSGKDVTDGEIFYGGEYYQLTGVDGTTNVAQFSLVKTQDSTADPLDFSDGQTHNVHDIFKFVGTDTATTGTFDSSELVSAYGSGKVNTFLSAGTSVISSTSWADLSGASYTTPNDGVTRTYSIVGKTNNNFIASSGVSDGGGLKLVVDGVDQDESFGRLANSGGDVTTVNLTSTVISTITVAPNKVIKLQVKSVGGGSVSVEFGKLSIFEL
jgi:hypothetical protein